MAAKSSLKNMALCLTAVCALCAAILGGVYAMTYDPIQEAAAKALAESIGMVLPEGTLSEAKTAEFDGGVYEYYTSTAADGSQAFAVKSTVIGFGGPLTLMVGVLADGSVYNTAVLECNETPGLGAKCQTDEHFIAQWKGFNGIFKVKKDGGDVDAITASTITSRAYTEAVCNAVALAKTLVSQEPEAEEETESEPINEEE